MKRFGAMLGAVGLAACAQRLTERNWQRSAVYGATAEPAIEAARTHCQKYGRMARPTKTNAYLGTLTFSCEKP
jgi:hypothetical protein